MTNDKMFYVEKAQSLWGNDRHETLEDATEQARKLAWKSADSMGIFKMIAVAEKPEQVNTVKVTEL